MSSHSTSREPSWRRLGGGTGVVFLVILAFLAGRLRSGADPAAQAAQASQAAPAATVAPAPAVDPGYTDPGYTAPAPDPNPPTTSAS